MTFHLSMITLIEKSKSMLKICGHPKIVKIVNLINN
jgi:hypothetical protein